MKNAQEVLELLIEDDSDLPQPNVYQSLVSGYFLLMSSNYFYLTTHHEWNLKTQLKTTKYHSMPTCFIRIFSEYKHTGLNEERGEWILEFWKKITENNFTIEGHRFSWSEVILFDRIMDEDKFKKIVLNLLLSLTANNLKSLTVFSKLSGDAEQKIQEIERMSLQLDKIGYWKEHIYPAYYENGREIKL